MSFDKYDRTNINTIHNVKPCNVHVVECRREIVFPKRNYRQDPLLENTAPVGFGLIRDRPSSYPDEPRTPTGTNTLKSSDGSTERKVKHALDAWYCDRDIDYDHNLVLNNPMTRKLFQ
jgi:hypothetical protein